MRAEVGFQRDWSGDHHRRGYGALTDRLELVVSSGSATEQTMLATLAKRLGLGFDESSGSLTIREPAPADVLPEAEAR